MKTHVPEIVALCLSVVMVIACSSPNPSSSSPQTQASSTATKKEPAFYTGKSCLSQMADKAARWQPDALPFHMESGLNAESTGHDGKSTIWRAMFASPGRRTYKPFICSGSRLPAEPAIGVTSGAESAYAPNVPQLMFQSFYLTADSDKAFAAAQEKGGSKLLEKDPQQPVLYSLDWDTKHKQLLWTVIYGTSQNDSKGMGVIDASTGKFLRAAK
ncbi:MAG: hypothetical protein WAQ52_10710 [Terriglobales bacterium]